MIPFLLLAVLLLVVPRGLHSALRITELSTERCSAFMVVVLEVQELCNETF